MRPMARPPGSIEPDALRLVIGLLIAFVFVGFAVLFSASVVALTTYLVAVLGSLTAFTAVLLWPDPSARTERRARRKKP
jgi:predicted tellurium resistance membrane protein TerC